VIDAVNALSNIVDNFKPGEVYNVGGGEFHDIETLAGYVVRASGADPALVSYQDSEPFTTKEKRIDNRKAVRDLDFHATVSLEEGIRRTVDWMRTVYQMGGSVVVNTDVL
jgi:dTDP-glucose 4,6-dehydratase